MNSTLHTWEDLADWRRYRRGLERSNLGFVPSLGGLHAGHGALVQRAVRENPQVVVSLFLNPTQFNQPADLAAYAADREQDLEKLRAWGVQHVLLPKVEALYADGFRYRLSESEDSQRLCGAHRPGHFDGVLSVVLRLLNLVQPARAYFGEKDWQQLQLVKGMVAALFLDVEIVACPTVREADGLALSTRNARLDPASRRVAPLLYRVLREAGDRESASRQLKQAGFEVDYVEEWQGRRLAAARLGDVRLIDNVELEGSHATGE